MHLPHLLQKMLLLYCFLSMRCKILHSNRGIFVLVLCFCQEKRSALLCPCIPSISVLSSFTIFNSRGTTESIGDFFLLIASEKLPGARENAALRFVSQHALCGDPQNCTHPRTIQLLL